MGPLLPGKLLPLYLWHGSVAKNQNAKVIHHSILLFRIVVCKILLQSLEEFLFSTLLALKTEAYKRGDCSANTRIDGIRVPLHLTGDCRRESDAKPPFNLSPTTRFWFAPVAMKAALHPDCI
jgi:hypothetical protein